jgi:predicted methyltransferase
MHRIKDTTPLADTRSKVSALNHPRGKVLDTATGLGYTAIELARTAVEVVTVELDPAAIDLARMNPWSKDLFNARNIRSVIGDVYDVLDTFADGEFAAILHDPPTMQLAGDLYSSAFYRKLRRVLRRDGRLFHYIGDPESSTGARTTRGVMQRLQEAGFRQVKRHPRAFGITAMG